MLRRLIDFLVDRKFYDTHFEFYLKNEVYPDLELISELVAELDDGEPISLCNRNPLFLDLDDVRIKILELKRTVYKIYGGCPSAFYPEVSNYLKVEYDYL